MRYILHIDMNKFYASVEQLLDPRLRHRAIAVCGSTEERHGIVLTASQEAKRMGVKTGMANWQAKQVCPMLQIVPPHYEQYMKYSILARKLYARYSDRIEPYGMDESWVDISPLCKSFSDAEKIADQIRLGVREELGLTVSVGVSFSKIFAKLGSDMKKPDAVTVLDDINWREKIWPLPASDLLYVGKSTIRRLMGYGVYTIGDMAKTEPQLMTDWFGKNGAVLWNFANGFDQAHVMPSDFVAPIKSVGHGITCSRDLMNNDEIWRVMLELAQDVGYRLRRVRLAACGVQIWVRSSQLFGQQYQKKLFYPTQSPLELAREGFSLFEKRYQWTEPVRSICVRGISLVDEKSPVQLGFFEDAEKRDKRDKLEACVDELRDRFGKHCLISASLMKEVPIPDDGREIVVMPDRMFE